jgi:hypothetical protein
MNGNPENIRFAALYFPRVQPSADLNPQRRHRFRDRPCTQDGSSGTVEKREKPISKTPTSSPIIQPDTPGPRLRPSIAANRSPRPSRTNHIHPLAAAKSP